MFELKKETAAFCCWVWWTEQRKRSCTTSPTVCSLGATWTEWSHSWFDN